MDARRSEPTHAARAASFAGVAAEYDRGRPGYPLSAVTWLLGDAPLHVVDLGAGTGKLTEALVVAGHRVTAVEPLEEMREVLAERVPEATVVAGRAEATGLPDGSADAVVAGAAFHWFDTDPTLAEVRRLLRPPGVLGLLGNAVDRSVDWVAALGGLLGPARLGREGHWPEPGLLGHMFGEVDDERFAHGQTATPATVSDYVRSRSGVAVMEPAERERLLAEVARLWDTEPALAGRAEVVLPWLCHVRRCRGLRPR